MSLKEYNRKRNFKKTPEPAGKPVRGKGPLRFVIQLHHASRVHYDFRLEIGGVLKSWAIPKGPSTNPLDQRLAVAVEDHPMPYGEFEGIIPAGNYGAGTVMIWDEGTFLERSSADRKQSELLLAKNLEKGHITFLLDGHKLRGEYALIKLKRTNDNAWLLVKKRDEFASYKDVTRQDRSVKTDRTIAEIAEEAEAKDEVWIPRRDDNEKRLAKVQRARAAAGPTKPAPRAEPRRVVAKAPPPKPAPKASPKNTAKATAGPMPRKNHPMLPTIARAPFDREGWLFEILPDGHRAIAEVEEGRVHLYSRHLLPFERKFPSLVDALHEVPHRAVIDGEIHERKGKPVFRALDLLYLDGEDLRELPLRERKKRLESLKGLYSDRVEYSSHSRDEGTALYESAAAGSILLARDAESAYRKGTSSAWIKVPIGATKRKAAEPGEALSTEERGPQLTHTDKIYWPEDKLTKRDLIEYYRQVAPLLLPHLKDRPQSMNRHPNGIDQPSFFQKDLTGYFPKFVKTERVYSHSTAKSIHFLLCQNEQTLLYMANLGCIELNPWISRVGSLDEPDYSVIDLDPDDRNTFKQVVEVAQETRRVLEKIGAESHVKTSGATGLHVCIPFPSGSDYDASRDFAHAVCKVVHARMPEITSLERSPSKRRGKIYLDFLQNRAGQTLASVYCVRPRPGATVSTPLRWKELTSRMDPADFTMKTAVKRFKKVGDLWKPMLTSSIDVAASVRKLAKL